MGWRPIPAIWSLQRDLDKQFPNRTKPDWIIGDADHSSRVSDHNPEDPDPGEGNWREVHAIDIRLGGDLRPREVLEATIGDERVWYVIHNGKIYSRTYGWEAREYRGANPHTTHIHVSFRYVEKQERNTSSWFDTRKPRVKPLKIDLSDVREQFFRALGLRKGRVQEDVSVRRFQRALNSLYPNRTIAVDGRVGPDTIALWAYHERKWGRSGRPRVPDARTAAMLVRARWRVVR